MDYERNKALDGLRGLAAVVVIFYHAILCDPRLISEVLARNAQDVASFDIPAKILLAVCSGYTAVIIFFVLSGYVLMQSLSRAKGSTSAIARDFVIRRIFRIYPALIVCIGVCFVVATVAGSAIEGHAAASSPLAVALNALLINTGVHGATWTLQLEILMIPVLLLAFVASRIGGTLAALGCLVYGMAATQIPTLVGHINALQYFLVAFLAGAMMTCSALVPFLSRVGPALPLVPLALASLNAFVPFGFPLLFAEVFLCALLVGGIARAVSALPLIELLSSRPFRFLGSVSYSVYLINVPVMWLTIAAFAKLGVRLTALSSGLLLGSIVLIVSLPIAAASKRVIEDPSIALGAWLTSKRRDLRLPRDLGSSRGIAGEKLALVTALSSAGAHGWRAINGARDRAEAGQ